MFPRYRFYIKVEDTVKQVFPMYGSGLSKNFTKKSGEAIFRVSLDGKLKFVKDDYDYIMSCPFDTSFTVIIHRQASKDSEFKPYIEGKFTKTDCTFNVQDRVIETGLTISDQYEDILAGLEKEFNLIELAPEIEGLYLYKRPAVQIYVELSDVLTTFIGGTYFEQSCDYNISDSDLKNKYGFAQSSLIDTYTISTENNGYKDYVGTYISKSELLRYYKSSDLEVSPGVYWSANYLIATRADNKYYLRIGIYSDLYKRFIEIVRTSDDTVLYNYTWYDEPLDQVDEDFNVGQTRSVFSGNATLHFNSEVRVYSRMLHNLNSLDTGASVIDIPSDDIVENNVNYKKCTPFKVTDEIFVSSALSEEPTEFGLYQPKQYYTKPEKNGQYYPVGRSGWGLSSIWYKPDIATSDLFDLGYRKSYKLKHAYPLHSCIAVLLKQIAPGLKHDENSSEFLYKNPNYVSGDSFKIYLTQKTNILKGEYDKPAQKAVTTLKEILDMLKTCFQCYWYIEDNELRIEHISFFQRGKKITGEQEVGLDLTALYDNKIKKPWSMLGSTYSYEKPDMPEQYKFAWMDEVTEPFEGKPIEIKSGYVEKGKIEDVTVTNFSSDVDYMLLNPSAFSEDGLALLIAKNADVFGYSSRYLVNFMASGPETYSTQKHSVLEIAENDDRTVSAQIDITTSDATCKLVFYKGNDILGYSQELTTPSGLVHTIDFTFELPYGTTHIGLYAVNKKMAAVLTKAEFLNTYGLPFIYKDFLGFKYSLQNGLASFSDLQYKYYRNSLPASKVVINGEELTVIPTKGKKQEIKFPSDDGNIDVYKLIRTSIGVGEVESVKVSLSTGLATVNLLYDTEK